MKIIRRIQDIRRFKKPVVAIGVFDGMHRAHCFILGEAVRQARAIGGTSVVITFCPDPRGQQSIYSCDHRLRIMDSLGVDVCVVVRFSASFARMSADGFIRRILWQRLRVARVYIGENFRFGYQGQGTVQLLRAQARRYGFAVRSFGIKRYSHRPISSTNIRRLIARGDLAAAAGLLGRPVSVLGSVVRGAGIGRRLGFPTANISVHHEVIPPAGIYAVTVIVDGERRGGACYIGTRPTFSRGSRVSIEVFVFGRIGPLYGKAIEVQFVRKLRNDQKFPCASSLAGQIRKDIILARKFLSRH